DKQLSQEAVTGDIRHQSSSDITEYCGAYIGGYFDEEIDAKARDYGQLVLTRQTIHVERSPKDATDSLYRPLYCDFAQLGVVQSVLASQDQHPLNAGR
ncbi:MAG: hypothetical protein L6R42_009208, partial [Xanthoria sp. 1 TBL-2021]